MDSQRTKQHICKPHNPTHDHPENFREQKSCFLACTPADIGIFALIENFKKEN